MEEKIKISKENPFRVPENYFEGLTEKVVAGSVKAEHVPQKKRIIRILRPFLLAAASVAILTAIGLTLLHFTGRKPGVNPTEEFFSANFSARELNEIDISTLEDSLAANEEIISLPDVSRNEIIDYLASEEINILDIYEQL